MKYFSEFPVISYPFEIDGQQVRVNLTDLLVRYRILPEVEKDPFAYYEYIVKDNETPYMVADFYYDDPDLAWLVMISNNIKDMQYDFPVPDNLFKEYIEEKYQMTYEQTQQIVHHYEDSDGDIIDLVTYQDQVEQSLIDIDVNPRAVTIHDFEFERNESKRKIRLLSKKYVKQIKDELRNNLQKIIEKRETALTDFITYD